MVMGGQTSGGCRTVCCPWNTCEHKAGHIPPIKQDKSLMTSTLPPVFTVGPPKMARFISVFLSNHTKRGTLLFTNMEADPSALEDYISLEPHGGFHGGGGKQKEDTVNSPNTNTCPSGDLAQKSLSFLFTTNLVCARSSKSFRNSGIELPGGLSDSPCQRTRAPVNMISEHSPKRSWELGESGQGSLDFPKSKVDQSTVSSI